MKNFACAFLIFFVSFFAFGQNQEISKIISLRKKNLKPIKDQLIKTEDVPSAKIKVIRNFKLKRKLQ